MKNKFFHSFQAKIIMSFCISAVISGLITSAAYYMAASYYRQNAVFGDPLFQFRQLIRNTIGDFNVFLMIFLPVFFIIFMIASKYYANIVDTITKGLVEIAGYDDESEELNEGNFDRAVQNLNKAATNLLEAKEKEAMAQFSKDQLVLNIAHDLRTPLTSIYGYLSLLRDKEDLSEEQKQHYIDIAFNKTKKMERLIDDLFQFTKYNYGQMDVEKSKLDLTMLLTQVFDEFYPSFQEQNLTGRLSVAEAHIFVKGNGDLLARLFDNLISNAIRYGKEGKYVDVKLFKREPSAVIHVVNYGSFIPEEEADKIFDTFYRMEKSRNSTTGGAGLGLSIAKNIADLHGGRIKAISTYEHTLFEVALSLYQD